MGKIFSILLALALVLGFSLVATTPVAAASTWYVNPLGTDDGTHGTGPGAAAFKTIQYAINDGRVAGGDTILVAAGAYSENVNVNKSLTLTGASSATVTVIAASPTVSVFTVTASNVNISGFNATGTQMSGNEGYAGIKFGSGVKNCNIHDNILSNNQYGILLIEPVDNTALGNNTFTNNTASDCVVSGIEMQNTWGNTFTNNTANLNGSQGFRLANAKHNTFTGNTANSNGQPGNPNGGCGFFLVIAGATGSNDNTFTNNTANSNVNHGIRIDSSSGNTLIGNTCNSNGADGIKLKVAGDNTRLENNTFSSNAIGIEIASVGINATSLTVSYNNISGNTNYGVLNSGTGTLDARYNWWGANDGPGYVGPGHGDNVTANVLYSPWTKKTPTYTGTATVYFTPDAGTIGTVTGVPTPANPPAALPYGMFSFTVTGLSSGQTVIMTIELPGAVPVGSKWWKYQGGKWYSLPIGDDDGDNIITVTLIDNVQGDADSTPGQILDDGGPGYPAVGYYYAELVANITAPANNVSIVGGREFTVSVNVTNTGDKWATNVTAAIDISGNAILKPVAGNVPTKVLVPWPNWFAANATAAVNWILVCTGEGAVNITVTPSGLDSETGGLIVGSRLHSDSVIINQQKILQVTIVAPPEGKAYNVTNEFEVKAIVTNNSSLNATDVKLIISIDRYAELKAGENATRTVGTLYFGATSTNYTWTLTCTGDGFSRITVRPSGNVDGAAIQDAALTPATVKVHQGDFDEANITLVKGWNLISLPLIPLDPTIEVVLAGIQDYVISVWNWAGGWYTFAPSAPSNLQQMKDGKAYWINMKAAQTLNLAGRENAVPPALPPTYDVVVGWNMVGFKSTAANVTAADYLAGTEYVRIYYFKSGAWYTIPGPSYNTTMVPGLGYWVAFTKAGTIYP